VVIIICFLLIVAGVIVYFCYGKKGVAARVGISLLLAGLFLLVWFFIWVSISDQWYLTGQPADTSYNAHLAISFIGCYLICLLFVFKAFSVKARRITAVLLAAAVIASNSVVAGLRVLNAARTYSSVAGEVESYGRDVSLVEYEPFRENTLAKSLDEPSSLRLLNNLPRLEGATALYPLYAAFARAVYPEDDYRVYSTDNVFAYNSHPVVTCSMTSGAFERLVNGEADLIFLMGVSEEQREMAHERGLELKLTPIGREAFVFFVNKRNNTSNLTVEDVKGIYSGKITNWRKVGGDNHSIRPYQRARNSGSQTMLLEIMGDTPLMTVPASDYHDLMYDIYQAVAVYRNYRNSLGYSFLFYISGMIADDEIKLLSIEGFEPTAENITNGTYPFANDFYAITVVREPENETDAERIINTERLIEWILSPQGQSLVEKTGYVPLN